MEPFIVTFRFETAPILRGGCTLDAVLGGEIARRVQRREEAIRRTPLACTDQVHHGSSLILLGDTGVSRPVPAVQNPRRAFLAAAAATISTARSRVTPGSAKNILNRYEARVSGQTIRAATQPSSSATVMPSRSTGMAFNRSCSRSRSGSVSLMARQLSALHRASQRRSSLSMAVKNRAYLAKSTPECGDDAAVGLAGVRAQTVTAVLRAGCYAAGHYSHPRSRKAERSTPGGAYQPPDA